MAEIQGSGEFTANWAHYRNLHGNTNNRLN